MSPKLVHFHVYDPKNSLFKTDANARAKAFFVWCSLEGTCPVRERGQCVHRGLFQSCVYGTAEQPEGPTRRARSFRDWIEKQEKRAGANPPSLSMATGVMAVIGDYVWLPYAHMEFERDTPTLKIQMFGGRRFLRTEEFTPAVIQHICEYRPLALFGGEIRDYQKESVPKFVRHLHEVMPELYAETLAVYPHLGELLGKTTNIGREAVLKTLAPNVGTFTDIHKGHWVWDGEWLVSTDSHMAFGLVDKFTEIRVKADPTSEVKVTDEAQVLPTTEFRS